MFCYVVLYCANSAMFWYVGFCCLMLCSVLCYFVLCSAMLRYVALANAILRNRFALCYAMLPLLCYVALC